MNFQISITDVAAHQLHSFPAREQRIVRAAVAAKLVEQNFMDIKTIPLSRLEEALQQTLTDCVDSGSTVFVEMPDHRLVSIRAFDPNDDDSLTDDLLEANAAFRALVAKSKSSPRKAFSLDPIG